MVKSTTGGIAGWSHPRRWSAILLMAIVSTIAACGGGGDGDTSSAGANATLAWDAAPSPEALGYRIYVGIAPGTYLQPPGQGADVGNVTTHTVTGLAGGTTYYFAATAYYAFGDESAYSNEVSKAIP